LVVVASDAKGRKEKESSESEEEEERREEVSEKANLGRRVSHPLPSLPSHSSSSRENQFSLLLTP